MLLRDREPSEGTSSDVGVFALFSAVELAVVRILDSAKSAERYFLGLDGWDDVPGRLTGVVERGVETPDDEATALATVRCCGYETIRAAMDD